MKTIESLEALEQLYGTPVSGALTKERSELTPLYRRWLASARFCILSTVGPEGTDASPRGDVDPVVRVVNPTTLHLPDWRGNNRIDSLRNIVQDERVSLLFMVNGVNNVIRVNGRAQLVVDPAVVGSFVQNGKHPRCVIETAIESVYFQCAKALMRSALWSPAPDTPELPTAGDFLKEVDSTFDGNAYDSGYEAYAKPRLW